MLLGGSAVQGLFYKGGRGRGETACMDTITQTKEQGTFWRPHVQATPKLPDFVSEDQISTPQLPFWYLLPTTQLLFKSIFSDHFLCSF